MKTVQVLCRLIFLITYLLRESKAYEAESDGVYIVYMGSAANSRNNHNLLLTSLVERKRNAVVHNYRNNFLGFAAHLTKEEANDIARQPGVVSVFPDPLLKLHTTRSWDFLKYQTSVETDFRPSDKCRNSSSNAASDIIIGVMDTGIWPESASFNDEGFGPIPSKWKGTCMQSDDFTTANCNRKLIGARYYKAGGALNSPRDGHGHGTHVASTAAGNTIHNASYYGIAEGSAKGGFPGSRIASYRVCGVSGCLGSNILAAFDDAIEDGVDVLSLSLGGSAADGPNFQRDPVAIGAFHAAEKGITVVCSAGNTGPSAGSVVNIAPWILTVAASSIDRDFQADITLGDKTVIKGGGINFGELQRSPIYPLLYGNTAKINYSNENNARNCKPDSLDKDKVKGSIVVCETEEGRSSAKQKLALIKKLGAVGMVFVNDDARAVASSYGSFPMATVNRDDGKRIISYTQSERNPMATISSTVSVTQYKPAPVVPYFSARGPSFATKDILKPDVAAPGVAILASWRDNDSVVKLAGKNPPLFYIISGTSMSCPHVSGLAAMIKSQNPNWSPSAIRSAIMTTASQTNNMKNPITTNTGSLATPYDFGAGEVSPNPLHPGLVYETEPTDYLHFLCNIGYNISTIKQISSTVPTNFTCHTNPNTHNSISNMNYPSIAISKFNGTEIIINRTVTNVGIGDTIYRASVEAPIGLEVRLVPNMLKFIDSKKQLSYQVIFKSHVGFDEDVFGAIIWSNDNYRVRSPFVVSSK